MRESDQFQKQLVRYTVNQLGSDNQDAEDLVQDALLDYFERRQVWYHLDPNPQTALLYKVLHRRFVDSFRRKLNEKHAVANFLQQMIFAPIISEEDLLDQLFAKHILDTLSPFWRQVISLRAEGWKWNEISDHFSIPIGTLTKQWARILRKTCKIFEIDCRKMEGSSDISHEGFPTVKAIPMEVTGNEETKIFVVDDLNADSFKPCPVSKHPQCPDKCSNTGGGSDFRNVSPGHCGCTQLQPFSLSELQTVLERNYEVSLPQKSDSSNRAFLSLPPCPTDCGEGTAYPDYFCLDEPVNCGILFQKHWWWIRWITYWNCPGANYYYCGNWMRDSEESCCMWAGGEVLPAECQPPGATYQECSLVTPP